MIESTDPSMYFASSEAISARAIAAHRTIVGMLSGIPAMGHDLVGDRRTIRGTVMPGAHIGDGAVFIGTGAVIEPGAFVATGSYIGQGAVVRHGAYLRENCVLLEGALIGHASEAKHALLMPYAKAPHFAYVGNSILGSNVNLGAGTKLSNMKVTPGNVKFLVGGSTHDTGLRKFGAILGDGVQTGCNVVLNPGTIIGRGTLVYAGSVLRPGIYPANAVVKLEQSTNIALLDKSP